MRRKIREKVPFLSSIMILSAIICMFFVGCNKVPVSLTAKTFVVEQGNTIPNDMANYIKGQADAINLCTADFSKVDTYTIGTYDALIVHPDKKFDIKIQVVDTTSPEIVLTSEQLYIEVGESLHIADVICSISDRNSFVVGFSDDLTKADLDKIILDSVVLNELGEQTLEVIAKDCYNNISVKNISVMVVKADTPVPGVDDHTKETIDESKGVDEVLEETTLSSENVLSKEPVKPEENVQPDPPAPVEDEFAKYSTDYVPFGFGYENDPDTNRPTGVYWYVNRYAKYDADFIKDDEKTIYLTFDEGYENGYTSKILDTLKEKNVKAVFFITLPYAKDNQDLVKRMIDEGHVIGNHSATHPEGGLSPLSVDRQKEEVMKVHDYVRDTYGYEMYLFRYPTGAFSEQSLAIVQSLGYTSVFWSFAHRDWIVNEQPDVTESLNYALSRAHGGAIYLLHAVSATNTSMLGDFIDECRDKGFDFGYYSK